MRKPYTYRWTIRVPRDVHEARQPHTNEIRGLIRRVRAILSKGRDGDNNQCRIERDEIMIPQSQSSHLPWRTRFNEKIRGLHQAFEERSPVYSGQIEGDATLVGRISPPEQATLRMHIILIERADTP